MFARFIQGVNKSVGNKAMNEGKTPYIDILLTDKV